MSKRSFLGLENSSRSGSKISARFCVRKFTNLHWREKFFLVGMGYLRMDQVDLKMVHICLLVRLERLLHLSMDRLNHVPQFQVLGQGLSSLYPSESEPNPLPG